MGATKTYKIMQHVKETTVVEDMIVTKKKVMARFESLMSALADKGYKVVGSGDTRYVWNPNTKFVELYYIANQLED